MGGFDFDYWKQLAEDDPAAYFHAREQALEQFIARNPEYATALLQLQAHIDTTRLLAGTPGQACRELLGLLESQMRVLHTRLTELGLEVDALQGSLRRTR